MGEMIIAGWWNGMLCFCLRLDCFACVFGNTLRGVHIMMSLFVFKTFLARNRKLLNSSWSVEREHSGKSCSLNEFQLPAVRGRRNLRKECLECDGVWIPPKKFSLFLTQLTVSVWCRRGKTEIKFLRKRESFCVTMMNRSSNKKNRNLKRNRNLLESHKVMQRSCHEIRYFAKPWSTLEDALASLHVLQLKGISAKFIRYEESSKEWAHF